MCEMCRRPRPGRKRAVSPDFRMASDAIRSLSKQSLKARAVMAHRALLGYITSRNGRFCDEIMAHRLYRAARGWRIETRPGGKIIVAFRAQEGLRCAIVSASSPGSHHEIMGTPPRIHDNRAPVEPNTVACNG